MSSFFKKITPKFNASSGYLDSERVHGLILSGTVMAQENAYAEIGADALRLINSGYGVFLGGAKTPEIVMHAIQAGLIATKLGLSIYLEFHGDNCVVTETAICKTVGILYAVYGATLISGWGVPEVVKRFGIGRVDVGISITSQDFQAPELVEDVEPPAITVHIGNAH